MKIEKRMNAQRECLFLSIVLFLNESIMKRR